MKKIIITVATSLVLTIGISNVLTFKLNTVQNVPVATTSLISESKIPEQNVNMVLETETNPLGNTQIQLETPKSSTSSEQKKTTTIPKSDTKLKQSLSRGDSPIPSQNNTYINTSTSSNNTSKYGELLSWNQASSLIPRGSTVQVTDLSTGKTFNVNRTFGTNHLDGEASTVSDTNIIKSIWGGFSWARRPVIVSIDGQKIAASMTAMPHAGIDSAPALETVSNRSDGYGTGENLDTVKNNGMDGVIDIHFLNSTRHKDNRPDPQHQATILKAARK